MAHCFRPEDASVAEYRVARALHPLVLGCGLTIAAIAMFTGFARSETVASSPCAELVHDLPPLGITLPDRRVADLIAASPAANIRLDLKTVSGISMESTYGGSLNCQRNKVYKTTRSGRFELAIPEMFAGGEGALCAGDKVRIGSVNNAPMLLDEEPEEGRVFLTATRRVADGWTPLCTVTLDKAPRYEVSTQDCSGTDCAMFARLAVEMANRVGAAQSTGGNTTLSTRIHHGRLKVNCSGDGCPPSWEKTFLQVTLQKIPSMSQKRKFDQLLQTAEQDQIDVEPFQGPRSSNGHRGEEDYYESSFLPIMSGEEVLLGKIGHEAGMHSAPTSTVLFSVYRLQGQRFAAAASFRLDSTRYVFSAVRVSDTR